MLYIVTASGFKPMIILEALKVVSSMSDLAKRCDLVPSPISCWKRQFLEGAENVFTSKKRGKTKCTRTACANGTKAKRKQAIASNRGS